MKAGKSRNGNFVPGMTFRAFLASVLCMMLAALYTNYTAIFLFESYTISESAIPIPAILAVLGLTLFTGVFAAVFKLRLLTKAELVCVTFATMMAVPMMTQGFWHRFLGMVSATPRNQSYDYSDAFDDRLWPHGRNLLDGVFDASGGELVFSNSAAAEEKHIDYAFRIDPDDPSSPKPAEPHLITFLAKGEGVEAETEVFVQAFADDNPVPQTLFRGAPRARPTYLHQDGFGRFGGYGLIPAHTCHSNLVLRIGLFGRGRVAISDPRFFSVAALETIYRGRKIVDEAEWNAMAPEERPAYAAVRPARKWSLRSLAFYVQSLIPIREWTRPMFIWGSYVLMLLTALFCINVVMRRKWAESERYPMPNTRIPLAIAGAGDPDDSPFSSIWRNRWAWAGLVFALSYGVLKGAHSFNPHLPDLRVFIRLNEYVTNPIFGGMFHTEFVFSLFVCSIAVFFELNVLMSVIVGYWICRSAYFIGHVAGIDVNNGFPWFQEQALGAYIGYFAIVVALSSKYLWQVAKDAFRGTGADEADVLTPRAAVVLFVLCHIGVAAWSGLTGASVVAMSIMFSFLVLCGFIAAKYRAECGNPFGYFVPYNIMLFIGVIGGVPVFGIRGMLVSLLLTGFLTVTVFYLIPGMQFELLEIGRRMRIRPRHIAYTCLVGLFGGLFIGGWAFLSNGYAAGAETLRGQNFYQGYGWFITRIRAPLAQATAEWLREDAGVVIKSVNWGRRAMVFSGVTMAALTILRQYFAGFWFHPVGFMVGFTFQNDGANWGTLLVAWAIRYAVLKIGGARAVRSKLQPFFIGAFVGCVLAVGIFTFVNGRAAALGSPNFYEAIP